MCSKNDSIFWLLAVWSSRDIRAVGFSGRVTGRLLLAVERRIYETLIQFLCASYVRRCEIASIGNGAISVADEFGNERDTWSDRDSL